MLQDQQYCAQVVADQKMHPMHPPRRRDRCSQLYNPTTLLVRVFSLAMTAHKVQVTAAVHWRRCRQHTELLSKLDGKVTFTNTAAAASLQPPYQYMTATHAKAGIADAMSVILGALLSNRQQHTADNPQC